MGILKTMKMYKALTPEQKEIVDTKTIKGKKTAKQWLNLLQDVANLDTEADILRTKIKTRRWIFLAVAVFMFFMIILAPVGLIFLIFSIYYMIMYPKLKRIDLSNGFRSFVVPLLVVFREESAPKQKIALDMNLEDPLQEKYLKEYRPPSGRGYPKIKEYNYEVNWLNSLETELKDGAKIELKADDAVRERKITKRNPRGKIKNKRKVKIKHGLRAIISLPKANYTLMNAKDSQALRCEENENYYIFKIKGKGISYAELDTVEVEYFLGRIAMAYQRVKPK